MGNLTMVSGKPTINIVSGKPTLNVVDPSAIPTVTTPAITITVANGVWTASVDGLTSAMKAALDNSDPVYIKLVRDAGLNLRMGFDESRAHKTPSYPIFLGSPTHGNTRNFASMLSAHPDKAGWVDISSLLNSDHTSMNISTWANNAMKWAGEIMSNKYKYTQNYTNNGYWYQKFKFVLSLNRTSVTGGTSTSNEIQANWHYQGGTAGFNTSFTLSGGAIDIGN